MPAMIPMTVPRITVTNVALVAMMSEIRRPNSNWGKMSRPVPHSTPRMWVELMPPNSPNGLPPRSLIAFLSNAYGSIPIAGAILLLQGIVEIVRCAICLRDGTWPSREEDVEEVDVDKLKEMVHVDEAGLREPDPAVVVPGRGATQ